MWFVVFVIYEQLSESYLLSILLYINKHIIVVFLNVSVFKLFSILKSSFPKRVEMLLASILDWDCCLSARTSRKARASALYQSQLQFECGSRAKQTWDSKSVRQYTLVIKKIGGFFDSNFPITYKNSSWYIYAIRVWRVNRYYISINTIIYSVNHAATEVFRVCVYVESKK